MAAVNASGEAELKAFLEAAGRSLADAQQGLVPQERLATDMVIATADLELKVTMNTAPDGRLLVRPIALADIAQGKVAADTLSTLRINFVASASEVRAPTQPPKKTPGSVTDAIRNRDDIRNLTRVLGELDINPIFVPESRTWQVVVKDAKGRLIRETIVPDEPEGRVS